MKKITVFHLTNCPYCVLARRAVDALRAEDPELNGVDIEWIEESRTPERTRGYDYYYVPSAFVGDVKCFEAHPGDSYEVILEGFRRAFEVAR